jgi:hypothetical protein
MLRSAPRLAAWCAAKPGPILFGYEWVPALRSSASALRRVRDRGKRVPNTRSLTTSKKCAHHSSGQGSTIFQSSSPFLIFFISVVSPPLRRIQSFTVAG